MLVKLSRPRRWKASILFGSFSSHPTHGYKHSIYIRIFEDAEAEGGRLVKEADFEAKKKIKTKNFLAIQLCFYVVWQFSHLKWVKINNRYLQIW